MTKSPLKSPNDSVVEHLRRPDLGIWEIEFTIEDPGAYAKLWIIKRVADLARSRWSWISSPAPR